MTRWPTAVESQVWTTPSSGARDGDGEHAADGEEQQADVLVGEGVVDDGAEEEGLGQRDRSRSPR